MNYLKVSVNLGVCLACLLSLSHNATGQTHRFRGDKKAKPYTYSLPPIDRVELLKVKTYGISGRIDIESSKAVEGDEARRIATLWRAQRYESGSSICHFPAYGLKFYSRGKLLVHANVCWECNNFSFVIPNLKGTRGFDGKAKTGQALLKRFREAFPESQVRPP